MNRLRHFPRLWTGVGTMLICLASSAGHAKDPNQNEQVERYYHADVSAYSLQPDKGLETYQGSYGSGSIGSNGTFGTAIVRGQDRLSIEVTGKTKGDRFSATVAVKSGKAGEKTKAEILNRELDLTDLQPQSVEIARDDDGRIYRINIVPRVTEAPKPKLFNVIDLGYDRWSLPESDVILNDQEYAGKISMSGGRLATMDISGFASIEFSLVAFKDALPEGVLADGSITIKHGNDTVQVTNVKNGENRETLKGGPYRVYVRWKAPSMTQEQARAMITAQLPIAKARLNPQNSREKAMLDRMEQMSKSDRIRILSTSMGDINKNNVIEQK